MPLTTNSIEKQQLIKNCTKFVQKTACHHQQLNKNKNINGQQTKIAVSPCKKALKWGNILNIDNI